MDEVKKRIIECIQAIRGMDFHETSQLITGGWIDSFSLLQLITALEEQFKIKIPLHKVTPECFDSVDEIGKLILKMEGKEDNG